MRPIRPLLSVILALSIVCVVPAQIPLEPADNFGVGIPEVFLPSIWPTGISSSRARIRRS